MKLIESFADVLQYLNEGEIVLLKDHTSFHKEADHLVVHHPNAHYNLSFKQFAELYHHEVFYLYQPEDEIDENKDAAYYSWKSKSTH